MVGSFTANAMNGGFTNGDYAPPPSTHAAQLVREHAPSTRAGQANDAAVTFGQLLQEILSGEAPPETDVEINYKLIQVVTEAGIDVLSKGDPFATWDTLLPQAMDCIAVIQATIVRQPEVLLVGSSVSTESSRPPHLLLWLFPKLLTATFQSRCRSLCDPVSELLASAITALAKPLDWWEHAETVLDVYRDCIEELASELFNRSSAHGLTSFEVALPPARSIGLGSEVDEASLSALPVGTQLRIGDETSAVTALIVLLRAMYAVLNSQTGRFYMRKAVVPLRVSLYEITHRVLIYLLSRQELASSELNTSFLERILELYCALTSPTPSGSDSPRRASWPP